LKGTKEDPDALRWFRSLTRMSVHVRIWRRAHAERVGRQ